MSETDKKLLEKQQKVRDTKEYWQERYDLLKSMKDDIEKQNAEMLEALKVCVKSLDWAEEQINGLGFGVHFGTLEGTKTLIKKIEGGKE